MNDYLTRLALRALGRARVAQPLRRSQFEAGPELMESVLGTDEPVHPVEPPPTGQRSPVLSQPRLRPLARSVPDEHAKTRSRSDAVEASPTGEISRLTTPATERAARVRLPSPTLPPVVSGRLRTAIRSPRETEDRSAVAEETQGAPHAVRQAAGLPIPPDSNDPHTEEAPPAWEPRQTRRPGTRHEGHPDTRVSETFPAPGVRRTLSVEGTLMGPLNDTREREESAPLFEITSPITANAISPPSIRATGDKASSLEDETVLPHRPAGGQRVTFDKTTRFSEEDFSIDRGATAAYGPSTLNAGLPQPPAATRSDESVIEIHIGSIELHPPVEPEVTESFRETETLTLEDYLTRRRDRMP